MANLLVDERDVKFVLYEQLNIEELCESDAFPNSLEKCSTWSWKPLKN